MLGAQKRGPDEPGQRGFGAVRQRTGSPCADYKFNEFAMHSQSIY